MANESAERIVGVLTGSVWERFNRLQASAAAALGNRRHPGGVFRFADYEELAQWNRQVSLRPPEPRTGTTSSDSVGN